MNLLLQLLANGLVNGTLFAVLAVGFGLVWRTTNVFHVAYGGLYVGCAYCFHILVARLGTPVWCGLLLTVALAGLAGALIEIGFYRPFYRKQTSAGAVLIASLGLFVTLENMIALGFGNELQTLTRATAPALQLGLVMLTQLQIVQFVAGVSVIGVFWLLVRRIPIFKAFWAIGDQPELISALGLPLFRLRALVFAISTILVAVPAALITLDLGADPHMGMSYLLVAAVSVLVGGRDSYCGWVGGAVLLALLQSLVVWKFSARWIDLVTFGLLVQILIFRPNGLFVRQRRGEGAT